MQPASTAMALLVRQSPSHIALKIRLPVGRELQQVSLDIGLVCCIPDGSSKPTFRIRVIAPCQQVPAKPWIEAESFVEIRERPVQASFLMFWRLFGWDMPVADGDTIIVQLPQTKPQSTFPIFALTARVPPPSLRDLGIWRLEPVSGTLYFRSGALR